MIDYTFCKKDGTIKKNYIGMCKYLITAKMQHHEITVGRHNEIVDEYDCYTTPTLYLCAEAQRRYIKNIHNICSNFDVNIHEWVYPDLSIDLLGDNVENMLEILKTLLGEA